MNKNKNILKLKDLYINYSLSHKSDSQRILFFSVGSAANLIEKKCFKLEEKDMHQYPPFIQTLKKGRFGEDLEMDIFLIDPWIKDSPYLIKYLRNKGIKVYEDSTFSNIFNCSNGLHIYVFKEAVCYQGCNDVQNDTLDITPMLMQFNERCIQNVDLLLFHDFSGRDVWKLADYFDKFIGDCLDRIIYDLTLRKQGSCYVNLVDPSYFLPIQYINHGIKLINPYSYSIQKLSLILHGNIDQNLRNQLIIPIIKKKYMFKTEIYPLLRRFINHKKEVELGNSDIKSFFTKVRYSEFFVSQLYTDTDLFGLYLAYKDKKTIDLLDDLIFNLRSIVHNYLVDIFHFYDDNIDDVVDFVKLRMSIIENDIYSWPENIMKEFENKLMKIGVVDSSTQLITSYI